MLILFVAILLAAVSVATFPCWPYSARWGHGPSVIAGVLLFCVAVVAVGGKSTPRAAAAMEVASASSPTIAYNAFHRRVETVISEPENAVQ